LGAGESYGSIIAMWEFTDYEIRSTNKSRNKIAKEECEAEPNLE